MAEIREGLLYTRDHLWIAITENKARIGMTDHAQDDLGDVVFVDLPKEGDVTKGDEFAALESVKTVEPICSPLSGKVGSSNKELSDTPDLVNTSPYDDGWIVIMEISDRSELDGLMNHTEYEEFLNSVKGN